MNEDEQLVESYLLNAGCKKVVYEPLGKGKPPDFSVNGSIGVEVRKLNQNWVAEGKYEGLEKEQHRLCQILEASLREFDTEYVGVTRAVRIRFVRPIEVSNTILKKEIRRVLSEFLEHDGSPYSQGDPIPVVDGISLNFRNCGLHPGKTFVLCGHNDVNSGGWVQDALEKNLRICSEEKLGKMQPCRHIYQEWWLALVDHLVPFTSCYNPEIVKQATKCSPEWDKVLLINPLALDKSIISSRLS